MSSSIKIEFDPKEHSYQDAIDTAKMVMRDSEGKVDFTKSTTVRIKDKKVVLTQAGNVKYKK